MDRARYADLIGEAYMENKLDKIADFLSVEDFIALGDMLLEKAEYEKAESHYLSARKLAGASHYEQGTEAAMAALEKLYAQGAEIYSMGLTKYQELGDSANEQYVGRKLESVAAKAAEEEEKRKTAESLERQGMQAQGNGDYWSAKSFYLQAKNLYLELGSDTDVERLATLAEQMDAMTGAE